MPELLLQSGLSWGSGRHHNGDQLELGATSGIPLGDELLGISLAATYANAAHLRVQAAGLRLLGSDAEAGRTGAWP